jgi:predicted cupin superfamily sugar epimerase
MTDDVKKIINNLNLTKHIEGGYFKRTYQSDVQVVLKDGSRSITTAIYYLLESGDFSCWHRLKSDEIWHYYAGSTVVIHMINEKGVLESHYLGNLLTDFTLKPQCIIPSNTWFAAEVLSAESFVLIGCTVSPGFEFADFEVGQRNDLLKHFPQYEELILKLTRE